MGQAHLLFNLPESKGKLKHHELLCSTIQMAILMLFNGQQDGITIAKICDVLKVDEETARKNLASLRNPKMPILLCKKAEVEEQS